MFTDRPCWQQTLKHAEIEANDKRGISATDKIYFTTKPELNAEHNLVVTNLDTGDTFTFEVRSRAIPDASAGLGILYRVFAERTTVGTTPDD